LLSHLNTALKLNRSIGLSIAARLQVLADPGSGESKARSKLKSLGNIEAKTDFSASSW
jgi:hypothetical protein